MVANHGQFFFSAFGGIPQPATHDPPIHIQHADIMKGSSPKQTRQFSGWKLHQLSDRPTDSHRTKARIAQIWVENPEHLDCHLDRHIHSRATNRSGHASLTSSRVLP